MMKNKISTCVGEFGNFEKCGFLKLSRTRVHTHLQNKKTRERALEPFIMAAASLQGVGGWGELGGRQKCLFLGPKAGTRSAPPISKLASACSNSLRKLCHPLSVNHSKRLKFSQTLLGHNCTLREQTKPIWPLTPSSLTSHRSAFPRTKFYLSIYQNQRALSGLY